MRFKILFVFVFLFWSLISFCFKILCVKTKGRRIRTVLNVSDFYIRHWSGYLPSPFSYLILFQLPTYPIVTVGLPTLQASSSISTFWRSLAPLVHLEKAALDLHFESSWGLTLESRILTFSIPAYWVFLSLFQERNLALRNTHFSLMPVQFICWFSGIRKFNPMLTFNFSTASIFFLLRRIIN